MFKFGGAEKWLVGLAIKKVTTRAIPWIISIAGSYLVKANAAGSHVGITLTIDDAALAAGLAAGLAMFQNYLKTKFKISWL